MLTSLISFATLLFLFNVGLACIVVFFGRRNPATTWVWLMALVIFPFVGFVLYLIFGRDIRKQRTFRHKNKDDCELRAKFFDNINAGIYKKVYEFQIKACKKRMQGENIDDYYKFSLGDLVYHNINVGGSCMTGNNDVTVYNNGREKFDALINDIKNAKKYIHMQYYIINKDKLGKEIVALLAEKAKEGLEVRFLYDGMGCMHNGRHFMSAIEKAGGKTVNFLPPLVPPFNIRLNYRNHRKIAIIDGEIGYLGGINIGDEYLGDVPRFGFWRDMHLRIKGGAIDQLQLRFIMDWNFASHVKMDVEQKYFPMREDNFSGVKMQVVSSGPDTDHENIKNLYFKMMNEAEKSIYFATPYFVPDDSILSSLKVAALSGIDVRLIFPGKPDHPFVYWASLSNVAELLEAGVKCYQYEKGFIHSKMLVVDGLVSSIGTANMDIRSFALNFETNAIIYDENIGALLDKQIFTDIEDCTQITEEWYKACPKTYRIKEAFSRLISPIL